MNDPNANDLKSSQRTCHEVSLAKLPIKNEVSFASDYTIEVTDCKHSRECHGDNFEIHKQPLIKPYVLDVNEKSRADYFYSCMKSHGWVKELF